MKFTSLDVNRYSQTFIQRAEERSRNDKYSRILKRILFFEVKDCNRNFTIEDFISHFYFDDTFRESYKELHKAIDETDFVYIHSYGKNGKSTFIEVFREVELLTKDFSTYFYDFRSRPSFNTASDLFECVKDFYLDFLNEHRYKRTSLNPFLSFFKYIVREFNIDVFSDIRDGFVKRNISKYVNLSKRFIDSLYITSTERGRELDDIEFFNLLCTEIHKEFELKKDQQDGFLDFVLMNILVATKVFYAVKSTEDKRVIFFLDNLDDVHTFIPEDMNVSYTANIMNFIQNLTKCYPNIFSDDSSLSSAHIEPTFVFVYRTSNYLSTLSSIYELDDSQRSRISFFDEESVKRVRITSVKDSYNIIRRRLDFYEALCDRIGIIKSDRYDLILNIIDSFTGLDSQYDSNFDPSTVLRLWNGNKMSFVRFMMNINIRKADLTILLDKSVPNRIKSEVFFHYFTKYYYEQSTSHSPFSKFITYSFNAFNNDLRDKRCNLSRLFFTYVYNVRRELGKIDSVKDVFEKGVSLSDFLDDLDKIRVGGKQMYSLKNIEDMFDKLFGFEIDNWGNFFSCCALTQGERHTSKEHYKWVNNTIESLSNRIESKNVRFFNNDSAKYFMFKLKRSFEYFSFSSSEVSSTSITLVSSLSYTRLANNNASAPYKSILNRVYKRVEEVSNITFEFFDIAFDMSVIDYSTSYWAYNGRMYFDDLISKVLDYVEQVRNSIVKLVIPIGGSYESYSEEIKREIRIEINKDFAVIEKKYIQLFFSLYNRSLERDKVMYDSNKLPEKMRHTASAFREMLEVANKLIENPDDFETEIISKNKKMKKQKSGV
ncbi:MAG: hypothetical protein AAGI23_05450 [Bacteroidota bacterium]